MQILNSTPWCFILDRDKGAGLNDMIFRQEKHLTIEGLEISYDHWNFPQLQDIVKARNKNQETR
jgi:hypothetical protein